MITNTSNVKSFNITSVPQTLNTPVYWTTADILVYDVDSSGDGTLLTESTHYTVTGAGASGGGTLSLTARVNTGTSSIVIISSPSQKQEADYIRNDDFPAETHEAALDKLTRMVQHLQRQVNRCVRVPVYEADELSPLGKTERVSTTVGFDASSDLTLT